MFIMWGYDKTMESLGSVGQGYCYDCRYKRSWLIGKETEWVVLYEIRTLPFKSKYYFVCEKCNDNISLRPRDYKKVNKLMKKRGTINNSRIHKKLLSRIESQQLSEKTPAQIEWIRGSIEAEEKAQRFRDSQ